MYELRERARDARAGFPSRGGGARRIAARAAFARALWTPTGERRLPSQRALDGALAALSRADLDWICELSPLAPLYLLPTQTFIRELAKVIAKLEVTRVLEVAAGDGFLSRCLAAALPTCEVVATDSGAWRNPRARMSDQERRTIDANGVPGLSLGTNVERIEARRAIEKHRPELVLCSWLPPGHRLLDTLVRAPARYVLELGAGNGVTASAYCWRFSHEFLEGPLESSARCRLDARPERALHSRATLYFARTHEEFHEERVRPGDFLYQFKP